MNSLSKAVFLDRDGTINKFDENNQVSYPEDLELLPGVIEAIQKLNKANYKIIVVTNQPRIAFGELTERQLINIHIKLKEILRKNNAFIYEIDYCPHYPKPVNGNISFYTKECNCRKPKPGLLLKNTKIHKIDLSKSYMIGDQPKDVEAGNAAGCKQSFLINEEKDLLYYVNLILREDK